MCGGAWLQACSEHVTTDAQDKPAVIMRGVTPGVDIGLAFAHNCDIAALIRHLLGEVVASVKQFVLPCPLVEGPSEPLDNGPRADELLDWGDHRFVEGVQQLGYVAVAVDWQEGAERCPRFDFCRERSLAFDEWSDRNRRHARGDRGELTAHHVGVGEIGDGERARAASVFIVSRIGFSACGWKSKRTGI